MHNIVITTFVLPTELEDFERILIDLNKASKFIDGNNFEFAIYLSVSDYLYDWESSKVNKQFFIDKFNSLKPLTNWAKSSNFQIRDDVLGVLSARRVAHKEHTEATHFIWLDSDMCFDDKILYFMLAGVNEIKESKYVLSPEIVKYWDTSWECLVNTNYKDKPYDYCKTNNPFTDCGMIDEVTLVPVRNNFTGYPTIKFGGGWCNLLSKPLLDRIPLPESMGHYGPDDTFVMYASEKLISAGERIVQYKLQNYVVCENYLFRDKRHYNNIITPIDRREEFKQMARSNFDIELHNIN